MGEGWRVLMGREEGSNGRVLMGEGVLVGEGSNGEEWRVLMGRVEGSNGEGGGF